jgi:hypothetical protein
VFFKSGSLYSCKPEDGFVCEKYMGDVRNMMNSVAVVEGAAGRCAKPERASNRSGREDGRAAHACRPAMPASGRTSWEALRGRPFLKKKSRSTRRQSGFSFLRMVGARRFELPTPTTPLWCATRLRYAPTVCLIRQQAASHEKRPPSNKGGHDNRRGMALEVENLAPQDLKNLFKFHSYLLDNLLTLRHI